MKDLPQADPVDTKSYAPEDGKKYSVRSVNSGKRLAIKAGAKDAGADVVQDNSLETPIVWRLEKMGDGFRMVSTGNGLALDATGKSAGGQAQVQPPRKDDTDDQVWMFVKVGDAYHIASKRTGLVLDVAGASQDDGASVVVYTRHRDNPAAHQLWILTEIKK